MFASLFKLALPLAVLAAQAPTFEPAAATPESNSTDYVGQSNGTLSNSPLVPGKAFDRVIQIWLENTDYDDAASSSVFKSLGEQGITLTQYYAVTHPSEPNYVAVVGGDFWGMADDNLYNIPSNISTVVDLLDAKNISWASYQENMPTDGFQGFNYTSENYLNSSAPPYTYYVRKHNPLVIYDSVANVPARLARHRNFNDFAADLNASAIPQWLFVTPNLVDDAHDTTIDFASDWLNFWLVPLLKDSNFNDNRTLIILTFDETETYTINNRVLTILLGGAIPENLKNTTDETYYSHYSCLSTVEANWGLGSLGRGDTNKTMSNVFSFVANATGYKNLDITGDAIPLTNATGTIPGPLNAELYVPFLAPNTTAVGAGGGSVFISNTTNTNLTTSSAPAPVNLTASGSSVPASGPDPTSTSPSGSSSGGSSSGGSGSSSGAVPGAKVAGGMIFGAVGAVVGAFLVL
ncbi:hypothetical protein SISNIDRAFT_406855 [Sistotremastrum niveocremeum HHB9708]|uniref:Phosphoesterase-domain-containing protein n=1 Tax=Sistotremastrum niveocremeum HHB9708 TaxID=1314777 RepID=A0A164YJM4_9AGAM|nr:hypothetical protein SISNIDRAFT_406855 [Sistotremastrum niveocremeum HHB9708]